MDTSNLPACRGVSKGDIIRALVAAGIKPLQVAHLVGTTPQLVAYYSRKSSTINAANMRKIADEIITEHALKVASACRLTISGALSKQINKILKEIDKGEDVNGVTRPLTWRSKGEAYQVAIKLAELKRTIEGDAATRIEVTGQVDINNVHTIVDHAIRNVSADLDNVIEANYEVVDPEDPAALPEPNKEIIDGNDK